MSRRGTLRPLSVAPMMNRTDRHFRMFLRQLTRHTLLYTEMVTTGALLRGDDPTRHLRFSEAEHPISLQLGGDEPRALAECARMAADWGYDEVNINIGCPSDRVQKGRFGACLMETPERVARGVEAMRAAVDLPVTVKHRIGVDDLDRYEDLLNFVDVVREAGADRFSVHARKAWLQGLSPKENRSVPPLRYPEVYRLKAERPELHIEINGGVKSLEAVALHLESVDAVMIGRAAYDDPGLFAEADQRFFDAPEAPRSAFTAIEALYPYAERHLSEGGRLHSITRHLHGLFAGQRGARVWRQVLSRAGGNPGAGVELLKEALDAVSASA